MLSLLEVEFWLYQSSTRLYQSFSRLYQSLSFVFSKLLLVFSFVFSNPIILIGSCLFFIFLMAFKGRLEFRTFKKNLFFSLAIFIFLLLFFELILSFGGYFYFYVYSNLDNPKIEKDAFRILFIGESTTAGAEIDKPEENAYAAQIEKILQQKYPNKKIRSYNKGIGAIETTAILRNLDRNMVKYKPHLVVLMAGWNDGFVPDKDTPNLKKWYSSFKLYRLVSSLMDIDKLESNMTYMPKEEGDFKYIGGPLLSYSYKPCNPLSQVLFNINTMIQTVHSYNSEIWLAGYLQPDARERVNPVLKGVAEENNITYVSDYPLVDFTINHSLFADDRWHPSKEGHAIIAEEIAEKIIGEGIIDRWQPN